MDMYTYIYIHICMYIYIFVYVYICIYTPNNNAHSLAAAQILMHPDAPEGVQEEVLPVAAERVVAFPELDLGVSVTRDQYICVSIDLYVILNMYNFLYYVIYIYNIMYIYKYIYLDMWQRAPSYMPCRPTFDLPQPGCAGMTSD